MRLINKSLTESLYQSLKEDFWNPCEYAEMIMNLDVDPKKWNEAKTQEERDAMVRPQLEEFWKKYGKDIKEKRLLRRIYADLEDSNFHTEGRILRDIVSKSSRKSKVNESVSYKDDKNFEDTVKRDFKLFLMDKYGDELYRDVDNDDINEYFTGMFYDIEDEDDLDAANEAEKIIRNEYNCLDSRDSSDDYEYDDGDTNWAAEEASDADERFENRYMSGGNGYTESAKTLKESSNIIWTSETTEDDYDKEELKANQYQDYLNDFDGTFKPMSYEEFLDSDWLYDYLRDYFEEQDEYKEWADFINSYNDVDLKEYYQEYLDTVKDTEPAKPKEFDDWFEDYMVDDSADQWNYKEEDLQENVLPMIDKQVNGAIFITGNYNSNYPEFRKSGPGGKIVKDGDDLINWLSDEDRVEFTNEEGNQVGVAAYDHDGSIGGLLFTLPDDRNEILNIAMSTGYYDKNDYEDTDEIIDEFLYDLDQGNVSMHDVKKIDTLVPIKNGFLITESTEETNQPNFVMFYLNGKELGGHDLANEFEGERQSAKELFAYENGVSPDEIEERLVYRESQPDWMQDEKLNNDFRQFVDNQLRDGAIDDPDYVKTLSDEEYEDLLVNTWMKDKDMIKGFEDVKGLKESLSLENKIKKYLDGDNLEENDISDYDAFDLLLKVVKKYPDNAKEAQQFIDEVKKTREEEPDENPFEILDYSTLDILDMANNVIPGKEEPPYNYEVYLDETCTGKLFVDLESALKYAKRMIKKYPIIYKVNPEIPYKELGVVTDYNNLDKINESVLTESKKEKKEEKRVIMQQGNVTCFKENDNTYLVFENTDDNEVEYDNQDDAMRDFLERVGVDPDNELVEDKASKGKITEKLDESNETEERTVGTYEVYKDGNKCNIEVKQVNNGKSKGYAVDNPFKGFEWGTNFYKTEDAVKQFLSKHNAKKKN